MRAVMDVCSTRARFGWRASAVLAGMGLLAAPAVARADTVPVITKDPAIIGTPQVGLELVADAAWSGDPKPTAAWAWQRCVKATGACAAIAGAGAPRYKVVEADVGTFLRVRVKVTNAAGSVTAQSKPTTVVLAAPTPAPTASPTATPTASPVATATPEPTVAAPPAPAASAAPVVVAPATLVPLALNPFPVVRIKGRLTSKGARVTLLTVRAPRDVRIDVDCKGSDCPARHYRAPAGERRLRRFERSLRAGTRLEVRVTKPGYVGKLTVFVFRRHAGPTRSDRCLVPGRTRPVTCT
jgi:hypothetical protein